MKIIVDADACPVRNIIEEVALRYKLDLLLVANINHLISSEYGSVITVDGNSQSADIAIINITLPGDIIVTQDYGLAAMVLGKGGYAVDNNGRQYTHKNIDSLLMQRYVSQKARQAGKRTGGPRKRKIDDDNDFRESLLRIVKYLLQL